ncbi:MAG TPA: 16S rRNA processing protein RimM [Firmicutes bacterium]|nr:16S rRNA processing protein RimM [Bacillota bacterium]
MVDRFIQIGRITAPQGIKGEVRVMPFTDFPERFIGLERVWVGPDPESTRELEIESTRLHKRFILVKFAGISSIDEAGRLRGLAIYVPHEQAVRLPPGRYFIHDIIGLDVLLTTGERIGRVAEVMTGEANDVYIVRADEEAGRGREILVPATRDIVKDIDIAGKRMVIEPRKGLI